MAKAEWAIRAQAKREARDALIPKKWHLAKVPTADEQPNVVNYINNFLSKEEVAITESSATDLLAKMAEGSLRYANPGVKTQLQS